ncbi:MAG: DUF4231 domain-containing protein [Pseudonocardia sp.]
MAKISEHGGVDPADRQVPLVVDSSAAGTGFAGHGAVVDQPVETTQIAPTILRLLKLDPNQLRAVQIEHTAELPGVAAPGARRVRSDHRVWDAVPVQLVEDLWRQRSVWSRGANRMKKRISQARAAALIAAVAAALAGTLSGALADSAPVPSRALAGVAALGAALLPILRPWWSGKALRNWTRARSVSEALKSEVYLWLARAGDYRDDRDGARLRERTNQVREDGADLLRYQLDLSPAQRSLPEVDDVPSYFTVRVSGQIDGYYRPKAAALQKSLSRFRAAEIGLAVTGALIAGGAAVFGGSLLAPWVAVITTITSALAVHVAATRNEYQLIEYLRTAQRLENLRSQALVASGTDELNALAVSAEEVISIENKGWMAKLAEEPDEQAGGDS